MGGGGATGGSGATGGTGPTGGSGGGSNTGPCEDHDCLNGAACFPAGEDAYTCDCAGTGFTGESCEEEINECDPDPCLQGADCSDLLSDYDCDCPDEYAGKRCELLTFELVDLLVYDLSPDGTVLVGDADSVAVIHRDGELDELGSYLGDTRSVAYATSTGGEVTVGVSANEDAGTSRAVVWENGTIVELEAPPGFPVCTANSVALDGGVIVGDCSDAASANPRVVRWVDRQVEVIEPPSGASACSEGFTSADGQVVFGSCSGSSDTQPMRWAEGDPLDAAVLLISSEDGCHFESSTADGLLGVGWCNPGGSTLDAFQWTDAGFELIAGDTQTAVYDISADGEFIVGRMGDLADGIWAALWDETRTPTWIEDVIAAEGVTPTGWTSFTSAENISADGNTIVGRGDLGTYVLRRN